MYFIQIFPQGRRLSGLLLLVLLTLSACSTTATKPAAKPKQVAALAAVVAQPAPAPAPASTPVLSALVSVETEMAVAQQPAIPPEAMTGVVGAVVIKETVSFLLGEAGWAFSQDRLTTPKGNSAYDYLQRVLVKQPKNPQALVALEQIVQRYYELVRSSLKQGKVAQAQVYLSRAQGVLPAHAGGPAMLKLIAARQPKPKAAMVSMPETQKPASRTQILTLTSTQLRQQGEVTVAWLTRLALKAQSLEATMLIVAPKDAQARWLYQTMNSADPELRIRANIKRGKPARIEVNYVARKDELEVYAD